MSIKPEYETYRYTSELCHTAAQSVVECRLPGSEINAVLATHTSIIPTECVCLDGEVKVNAKLFLSVVYEDANKNVCRVERGAEFFVRSENAQVTPACFAKPSFAVKNVTTRREGSGLYVAIVVETSSRVFGTATTEYLKSGENIVVKGKKERIFKTVCVSGETETEDEFETDYFGDVLLHSERAWVTKVVPLGDEIEISGEISLNVCALKEDGSLSSYERLIPFTMNMPCDEHGAESATARVKVSGANLSVTADEDKGKNKTVASFTLSADCTLYIPEEIECVEDAFSTTNEIRLKKEKRQGRYLLKEMRFTERVSGGAALNGDVDGSYTLLASVLPRGEIVYRKRYLPDGKESGVDAEGIVEADVLLRGEDGLHKTAVLSLPFAFPVSMEIEGETSAECLVCGLSVRRLSSGEFDAEATLKVSIKVYAESTAEYVSVIEEGEEFVQNDSAITVFIPREGDGLWEVSAKLKREPSEVEKSNPQLSFPIKKGERIVVYRQKA